MTRMSPLFSLVWLLWPFTWLFVGSCAKQQPGCQYQSKTYPVGASFPAASGCGSCVCYAEGVACSELCAADGSTDSALICFNVSGDVITCPGKPGACTVGADQTCNEDPTASSLRGTCNADGSCSCGTNAVSAYTGRCLNPGDTSGNGCEYGGVLLPPASLVTCLDRCNMCMCESPGVLRMTENPCPTDAGSPVCSLDATYVYGAIGGRVLYSDQVTLMPPSSYALVRTASSNAATSGACSPAFPSCGVASAIDVADVMSDLGDPTIQLLLSRSDQTLLGVDQRPSDGTVFSFKRTGGGGFLVGAPCTGQSSCDAIPASVTRLMNDLQSLDQLMEKDPSCQAFIATP